MLRHFFGRAGKTPDVVTSQEVFVWAYGNGLSGKTPSSTTIGARIACLSSFYHFLMRMKMVQANPCDQLERPRARQSTPRGLSADDIRRLLAVVPDTNAGLRDRAIILTLVLTGRRRAEVLNLKAGDLSSEGDAAYYTYRGKGGKTGRRELPRPAYEATQRALTAFGKNLATMGGGQPSHCGLVTAPAGSPQARFTCGCGSIFRWPACRSQEFISSGIAPRSCAGTRARRWRK